MRLHTLPPITPDSLDLSDVRLLWHGVPVEAAADMWRSAARSASLSGRIRAAVGMLRLADRIDSIAEKFAC